MRAGQKLKQAKRLRIDMTPTERKLWHHLRNRHFFHTKFRRQCAIGPYIADFVAIDIKLVIEIDGGQHALQKDYDQKRDDFFRQQGFTVLRFWNNEVLYNFEGVLTVIQQYLGPHPNPLPLFPAYAVAGEGENPSAGMTTI